jgi:hypothetical protein
VLLFHGTSADDEKLRSILREGLRASRNDWACHLIKDERAFVFLSTSPVAGKGGDPVAFARGWPMRARRSSEHARAPGYLIAVDLPEPSPVPIHGAARNGDVEAYWKARAFAHILEGRAQERTGETRLEALRRVFRCARGAPLGALLRPCTLRMAPGFVQGDVRPYELALAGRAYVEADTPQEKARIARAAGMNIPEAFAEDSHDRNCILCFDGQLYAFGYAFDGPPGVEEVGLLLPGQAFGEILDPGTMGAFLEAIRAWLDAYPEAEVDRALERGGGLSGLASLLPPPRDRVPLVLRPDFLAGYEPSLLREPDVQVMTGSIPPELLVGALRITENNRIRADLRPDRGRGETLPGKLWSAIHAMRRARGAHPIIA